MSETDYQPDRTIDARDATCPGPLMDLIGAVKEADPATVIELQTSDGGSKDDVPEWVAETDHELLDIVDDGAHWSIYVRTA
jgi:tRNA 2-thiouridine synthesizing protein A